MNAVIRGRQAIWGIVTSAGDTFAGGLIKSQKRDDDSDSETILDGEGFVIAEVFYNQKNECNIEIQCEASTTGPLVSADIQICGLLALVKSVSLNWEQKGWKSMQVKATKYVNLVP